MQAGSLALDGHVGYFSSVVGNGLEKRGILHIAVDVVMATEKDTALPVQTGNVVSAGLAAEKDTAFWVRCWQSDNYAEDWYRDAVAEARFGGDHNARRREVIFACCFAESFIFEWTRRKVQIAEIEDFFPATPRFNRKRNPRYRRDLERKWREVPKELHEAGKIAVQPNLDPALVAFGELLRYRHGLVHAAASRPATDAQPPETRPFPRKKDLKALKAGWAVSIVFDLVSELCDQLGEPKPDYLQKP